MTRFIYNGLYYPTIGSASMFMDHRYIPVLDRKLGGYGEHYREWLPSYGIKCRVWNEDKPYKQLVIDAINNHPDMELYKLYFNNQGFSEKEDSTDFMWYVKLKGTESTIGNIRDAYRITDLIHLQTQGPDSHQVCVGWSVKDHKYYGWSHRARVGFGTGDYIFEELQPDGTNYPDDTLYTQHGTKIIETFEEARLSAINFAKYIS